MKHSFKQTKAIFFNALIVVLSGTIGINLANASANLILDITVGTDLTPGVCALTDTLIVDSGTDVNFCYTLTNTGFTTLDTHTLDTNLYGNILTNISTEIPPAGTLVIPDNIETINSTVSVDATWMASGPIGLYTLLTSDNLGGPVYDFIDISSTGTALGLADDEISDVTIPFSFTFYSTESSNISVSNNGAIRFGVFGAHTFASNQTIASDIDNNLIAPFWDDIDDNTGDVYFETLGAQPNRVFVIQWEERPHFNNIGAASFQLKLFEATNEIEFHYEDVFFESSAIDAGASATVGIGGSANGLEFSFKTPSLSDNFAISFFPVVPSHIVETSADKGANYNFIDISVTGTALGLGDNGIADVTIPFEFEMGTISSADFTIGNNGAMRMGVLGAAINFANEVLSIDIVDNIIAPFWDDLSTLGEVYWEVQGMTPNQIFIVQWQEKNHFNGMPAERISIQAQLFEETNQIQFHYQDVDFSNVQLDFGASATVGIRGGTNAIQFSNQNPSLADSFAITFTPKISTVTGTDNIIVNVSTDVIFKNGFD